MEYTQKDIMDMVLSAFEQGEVRWSHDSVKVKFGRNGRWVEPTPELVRQGFEQVRAMKGRPARLLVMEGRTTASMAAFLALATGHKKEFEALKSEWE